VGLPFHLADYLELVNWTGRAVRDDKRGAIASRCSSFQLRQCSKERVVSAFCCADAQPAVQKGQRSVRLTGPPRRTPNGPGPGPRE